MSLFDSISRTVKGLLNDAADTVQDPSRDSRQIVRELDDSIAKAENSLIEIEAQVATQQSRRDVAAEKAKKYEDGAKRALQSGDEALAREALGAQANAETERDALAAELVTLVPSVDHLKQQRIEFTFEHLASEAADRNGERCRGNRVGRYRREEPVGRLSETGRQGCAIERTLGRTPEFRRPEKRQGARRQAGSAHTRTFCRRSSRSAQETNRTAGAVSARSFQAGRAANLAATLVFAGRLHRT